MRASTSCVDSSPLLEATVSQPVARPALGGGAAFAAACCMSFYVLTAEQHIMQRDPAGFLLLRQLLASFCLAGAAAYRHGWQLPPPDARRDVHILSVLQFFNAICFITGVSLAGSFVATVCQLSIPVLTFVYSACIGLEVPSLRRGLALLAVSTGCLLTTVGHAMQGAATQLEQQPTVRHQHPYRRQRGRLRVEPSPSPPSSVFHHAQDRSVHSLGGQSCSYGLGVALLVLQCSCFVGIVIVQRRVLRSHAVALVVSWSYGLASLWTFGYCVVQGSAWQLGTQIASASDIAAVSSSAVLGAACYFELIGVASKHLPPTLVACSVALEPLLVSFFGAIRFGRHTTYLEIWGYLLAALGACTMAALTENKSGGSGSTVAHEGGICKSSSGMSLEVATSVQAPCHSLITSRAGIFNLVVRTPDQPQPRW